MEPKPSWLQGPTNALGISVDLDALRARLQNMNEAATSAGASIGTSSCGKAG